MTESHESANIRGENGRPQVFRWPTSCLICRVTGTSERYTPRWGPLDSHRQRAIGPSYRLSSTSLTSLESKRPLLQRSHFLP